MKIGFSATTVQGGRSGVAQYKFSLIRQLVQIEGVDLTLFIHSRERHLFELAKGRCQIEELPLAASSPVGDILWHQLLLPLRAYRLGLDVVHVPSYRRMVFAAPCPQVATIHDLAPFRLRGKYDALRTFYGKVVAKRLAKRQQKLIAVSDNTAADIERFFGVARDRVEVIHNGIDHSRFHPRGRAAAREEIASIFGLERPFFLYVSRLEHPAKNHVRLIEAFERFKNETGSRWELVLAGGDWHGADQIKQAAAASSAADSIRFLGFVPDEDLPTLYRAAGAMVFPSLFEGFGLPPVEAMACGTPVISSTRGALEEVIGDGALVIDPESIANISAALVGFASDAAAAIGLRDRGFTNARRFRWERNAEAVVEIYKSVVVGSA